MSNSRRYQQMLLQLSHLIRDNELKGLKLYCKDVIPAKHREKITSSEDLFEKLEEKGMLSESNLAFLRELLEHALIGRTDVLKVVDEYEKPGRASIEDVDGAGLPDFLDVCHFLEDNLGLQYKSFLRRLRIEDHHIERAVVNNPGNMKEVIHQCLLVWLNTNKQRQHSELLAIVTNSLKREKLTELANRLESGNY